MTRPKMALTMRLAERRRVRLPLLVLMQASVIAGLPAVSAQAHGEHAQAGGTEAISVVPAHAVRSSDGARAAWPADDRSGFWFAERANGGAWSTPARFWVRGLVRDPVFAPDGRHLAFENKRGGHPTGRWNERSYEWSFIGVYDFDEGAVSYVDPAFARDAQPRWTSSRTLEYVRSIEGLPDVTLTAAVEKRAPALTGQKALLARLLEAATLYQPVASGDGSAIAFAAREGMVRSIYFARPGEKARRLVEYPGDDGQDLSQPALSPDGALAAYVRGSTLNSKGEVANPRFFPTPPQREVWVANTFPGAGARSLGPGDSPQFSPDGRRLVWQTARGVFSASLSGSGSTAAVGTVDVLLAGRATSLRFSPDGKRLAFQRVFDTASNRLVTERASRIEILDLPTGKLFGVARPVTANDTDPAWSPDSRQIAFVRVFREPPHRSTERPFEVSEPWAILAVDAQTGATREVWRALPGRGSIFYGLAPDPTGNDVGGEQLFWSADDQIGFVWEREGWRHLYAVAAGGGTARLLTSGDGEVEKATLSRDRSAILYAHNIGDLPGRHVSSVSFSGGAPKRLGDSSTNQWAPTALAGGVVAFIDAGSTKTQSVHFESPAGRRFDAGPAAPKDYPARVFVKPEAVEFAAADGKTTFGQLFAPRQGTGCGIVFIHGGKERQMLLGFHYIAVYSYLYVLNQYLASRGCAVLSVEYRGSLMRGESYRNIPGFGAEGRVSEYPDFLGAARYLESQARLRVKAVGIYGISYGGFATAIALGRNSDVFKAGFDMAGVHDFPGSSPEALLAAYVDRWASPVLIASGDDDRSVDHGQSMMLYSELMRRKPAFEVVGRVLPNETHDLYQSIDNLTNLYWDGSEFLLKHLQH